MPSAFDAYLSGIPDARTGMSASVFERSPMTSGQRLTRATNQLAAKSSILEARDRLAEFQRAETARRQAPGVMQALGGLDPVNDPDYRTKVLGILQQSPEAAMDKTVSNFLGVQDDVYSQAESERQWQAKGQAAWDLTEYKDTLSRARAAEAEKRDIARVERDLEARKREKQNATFEELPSATQQAIQERVDAGEDFGSALKVEREREATQQEINDLYEMGFRKADIEGKPNQQDRFPGILRPDGTVDPLKKAKLIGRGKRAADEALKVKEEVAALSNQMKMLDELVQDTDADDPDRPRWERELEEVKQKLSDRIGSAQPKAKPATEAATPAPVQPAPVNVQSFLTRGQSLKK